MKASSYISISKCSIFIFSLFKNAAKWNEMLSDTAPYGVLSLSNGPIKSQMESKFNARPTDVGFQMDKVAIGQIFL
jgi:hypothetical protein